MSSDQENQKIYDLLTQKNVSFVILREIETILFNAKKSSQKLILKILRNSSQYHDVQIIIDIGKNHSKNKFRRMINSIRNLPIHAVKLIFRISQNQAKTNNIFSYFTLIPDIGSLQEKIFIHPEYQIDYNIDYLQFKFLSDRKVRFINYEQNQIDFKFKIQQKQNKQLLEKGLIEQRSNLPLLLNFEEAFLCNFNIYGVDKNTFKISLGKVNYFEVNVKDVEIESNEMSTIFLEDIFNVVQKNKISSIGRFIYRNKWLVDSDEQFQKIMELKQICDQRDQVERITFENKNEELLFDFKFNVLQNRVLTESNKDSQIQPFRISNKIDKLQVFFKQNFNQLDFSEYILRCREYHLIQYIDVEIIYQTQAYYEVNSIPLNDLYDVLTKLKTLRQFSVKIKFSSVYNQFFQFAYERDTNTHTIKTGDKDIEFIKNLIIKEDVTNLFIQQQLSTNLIPTLQKSLLQLIQKMKMKKCISYSLLQQVQPVAYYQIQEVLSQFDQINFVFVDLNQMINFQMDQLQAKKVRKIEIINFAIPKQVKPSYFIENFPNIMKLKITTGVLPIKYNQVMTLIKYLVLKNSLCIILKQRNPQFKRVDVLNDMIFQFLC